MPDYAIKRLNFRLKDFTRSVWVSNQAGEVWYPRINQVLKYLREIELYSIAEGIRKCTIKLIDSEDISNIVTKFASYGLQVDLLKEVISNNINPSEEQPLKYWAVIGTDENNQVFKSAYQNGEQDTMSLLQGSPECCTNFFHKMGIEEKFFDMTWPMAVNTKEEEIQQNTIGVEPIFQCNTLLKSLGIKPVFHSPCSFNCPGTIELADKLNTLGEKIGYKKEINWLSEILSWPVEWSALHGIAEIKTPILKISTNTDATAVKYTVRFMGTLYPEETVTGLVFPYLQPDRLLISGSKSYKKGLLNNSPEEKNNFG